MSGGSLQRGEGGGPTFGGGRYTGSFDVLVADSRPAPVARGVATDDVTGLWALYDHPPGRPVADVDQSDAGEPDADRRDGTPGGVRPWVRGCMVTTVDGAAAGGDGLSGSVSSPADRVVFALLRGLADAVLVGAGTARQEDYGPVPVHPALGAVRRAEGRRPAPVVVQVSRSGRVHTGHGLADASSGSLAVVPDAEARARAAAVLGDADRVVVAGRAPDGGVDLPAALHELAQRKLLRVLAEGGPSLLGALAAAGLLDELCLTTSPLVVGGGFPRVTAGPAVTDGRWRLAGLLHADSTLLSRWRREPAAAGEVEAR